MRSAYDLTIGKGSVLCLALFCLLALPLSGCAKEQTLPDFTPLLSEETETDGIGTETESAARPPFAEEIRIVLPKDSSEALLLRAGALGDAIREKTGIFCTVLEDASLPMQEPNIYEIVLGNADHADATRYLAGLKRDDYVCAADEYIAVIGGKTEQATLRALDVFCQTLLPSVSREGLMETGVAILSEGTYPLGLCSLNGIALSDWQIVCDPDSESLCTLAERLCEIIAERSGYVLSVNPRKGTALRTVRLALSEERSDLSYLIPTEEGVTLLGENAMGLCRASDALCALLFDGADGKGDCQGSLQETQSLSVEGSRFHVSLLVGTKALSFDSVSEAVALTDPIRTEGRDAVAIWDMQDEAARYLTQNLSDLYSWQTSADGLIGTAMGASTPIDTDGTLLFGVGLNGEMGGIRWLGMREGEELPAQILAENTPIVLTVFGRTSGEAGKSTAARMDCLYRGSAEVDGSVVYVCVYTTVKQLRTETAWTGNRVGVLDLWVERIY